MWGVSNTRSKTLSYRLKWAVLLVRYSVSLNQTVHPAFVRVIYFIHITFKKLHRWKNKLALRVNKWTNIIIIQALFYANHWIKKHLQVQIKCEHTDESEWVYISRNVVCMIDSSSMGDGVDRYHRRHSTAHRHVRVLQALVEQEWGQGRREEGT